MATVNIGQPIIIGTVDQSGNIQVLGSQTPTDGSSIPSVGLYTFSSLALHNAAQNTLQFQRVASDMSDIISGQTIASNALMGFNASSSLYARLRTISSVTGGAVGTGILASGLVGYDASNTQNFYPVQSDSQGFLRMSGDVPHGVTDGGAPVEIGWQATAFGANPAAVTAGQRTRGYATRGGLPFWIGGHPNVITVRANYTSSTLNNAVVTNSPGTKLVVTGAMATVSNACSVNVPVRIGLSSSVTPTTTGVFLSHPNVAPGSGVGRGSGVGILGVGNDGEQVLITSGIPTGDSIDVIIEYFTVPS